MAQDIPIYPGSASFFPGDTPYGHYDDDTNFQCEVEEFTNWAARRLGYPIMEVELQDINFFAAYEEAVSEYGSYVSTYAARDNILGLLGMPTGALDVTSQYIPSTLSGVVKLAREYGTEVGSGGTLTWFTGSITTVVDKQVYSFVSDASIETGSFATDQFTIRKVLHEDAPASANYAGSLGSAMYLSNEFGWGQANMASDYLSMPLYENVLRAQAVEFNDQIRRSAYSFQITNNRIRIFPVPKDSFKIWFMYTLDNERVNLSSAANQGNQITNHSNIPAGRLNYTYINQMGKRWIRKYALALAKEMLGMVRGKYASLPAAGSNTVSLNYQELLSAAEKEKDMLVEELTTILDSFSRQSQLERKQSESDAIAQQLSRVPLKIYVG